MKKEKNILFFLFFLFVFLILFLLFLKIKGYFIKESKVYIYLTHQNDQTYLVPVVRKIKYTKKIEEKIKNAINELFKGPTEEEKEAGLSTSLNEDSKLLNVSIEKDTVNLDFSENIEEGGGTSLMETRIAQIVYTATQFPEIKKVRFLIEGKTINYFSGEGITIVEKPVSREDLKEFDIKIKEGGEL
ncbi:MAG: GerMN domain-containing protein [Candidatus Omnitrophica bacterium]|nr:GerMN domain-containing protein [Candidatus Omnitrophota bacterium]